MPHLEEAKHIKHRLLRVGNGAFFVVSNIFHQPFGIAPEGLFLPSGRLVRRLFSFHFPVAGWLREFNKNPKRSHHMANRNANPGIAVITQSHQTADNAGSDTNADAQKLNLTKE